MVDGRLLTKNEIMTALGVTADSGHADRSGESDVSKYLLPSTEIRHRIFLGRRREGQRDQW